MEYKGCAITINRCQDRGWGGYWDYVVKKPGELQKNIGRSRGLKKEVVSMLKWKIDNNEMFPRQEGKLTQRALDGAVCTCEKPLYRRRGYRFLCVHCKKPPRQ